VNVAALFAPGGPEPGARSIETAPGLLRNTDEGACLAATPDAALHWGPMRSVADDLRAETMSAVARLSVEERIGLALRLGDDDVALYRAAHGVSETEARVALARMRLVGRRQSRSNEPGRR
jgi:hypothetical protein